MSCDMGSRVGFELNVTRDDIRRSPNYHNNLPDEEILSTAGSEHLDQHRECLRQLIQESKAQDLFGVNFLHKHDTLPLDCCLDGHTGEFDGRRYYWTQIVAAKTLDPNELCGRNFVFIPGQGLRPYQFHRGPPPSLDGVDPMFFSRYAHYLDQNGLRWDFGLELIVPELSRVRMVEIVSQRCGTQILVEVAANDDDALLLWDSRSMVTTSWRWPSDPTAISGEVTKCVIWKDGTHKQYIISQGESHLKIQDVIRALNCTSSFPVKA